MTGQIEILRWIRVDAPAYAVTWLHKGQYAAVGTEEGLSLFDLTGRQLLAYPPESVDKQAVPIHQLVAADETDDPALGRVPGGGVIGCRAVVTGIHSRLTDVAHDVPPGSLSVDNPRDREVPAPRRQANPNTHPLAIKNRRTLLETPVLKCCAGGITSRPPRWRCWNGGIISGCLR